MQLIWLVFEQFVFRVKLCLKDHGQFLTQCASPCPVFISLNPSKGSINLMFAMYEKFDTFEDL